MGKVALDRGNKLAVVHIQFSTAVDCVTYYDLLFNLLDVAGYLSGRVQRGCG